MIDIHSHILPMIDDGAQTVPQALTMLEMAYRDGTDAMILTPHLAYEYGFINPKEKITALYQDLCRIVKAEQNPIELYLGCEFLFSSPDVFERHFHEITTLNHSCYLLTEFFFDVREEEILQAVDCVTAKGLIPILAHPERYDCIQTSPELLERLKAKGALFQINKGSVFGRYGEFAQEISTLMLDRRIVHFVGSDAHHPRRRTPMMDEAFRYITEVTNREYAELIFHNNAAKLLHNQQITEEITG